MVIHRCRQRPRLRERLYPMFEELSFLPFGQTHKLPSPSSPFPPSLRPLTSVRPYVRASFSLSSMLANSLLDSFPLAAQPLCCSICDHLLLPLSSTVFCLWPKSDSMCGNDSSGGAGRGELGYRRTFRARQEQESLRQRSFQTARRRTLN